MTANLYNKSFSLSITYSQNINRHLIYGTLSRRAAWVGLTSTLIFHTIILKAFMSLSPKKLILLGLGVILLIAIPLTVFVVQQQQQTRSNASPATQLSFIDPATQNPTTQSNPKIVTVGQNVTFDVVMDPGSNVVGGLTLIINYDSTKLQVVGQGITPNTAVMGNLLGDIQNTPGQINVSFSPAAIDPTKAITQKTTIGSITLKAANITEVGTPTQITFDSNTIVVPIGSGDTNSNVLAGSSPAFVAIAAEGEITPTPTTQAGVTPSPTATPRPSSTPVPTVTSAPAPTATPIPQAENQIPVCSGLAMDVPASGTTPYTVNFTATGTDSDGTISKVSFNFGEGAIEEVTSGGGIGTSSVNVPGVHTYSAAGTFTASAVLVDDAGGSSTACSQTITVTEGQAAPTGSTAQVTPVTEQPPTATPTIAATGPAETIMGIGILGILFTVVGIAVLLIL